MRIEHARTVEMDQVVGLSLRNTIWTGAERNDVPVNRASYQDHRADVKFLRDNIRSFMIT